MKYLTSKSLMVNENSMLSCDWINSKFFMLRFQKSFRVCTFNRERKGSFLIQPIFSLVCKKRVTTYCLAQKKKFLFFFCSNYILSLLSPASFRQGVFYFFRFKIKNIFEIKNKKNLYYIFGNEISNFKCGENIEKIFKIYILNLNEMRFIELFEMDQTSNKKGVIIDIIKGKNLFFCEKNKIYFFINRNCSDKILKFIFFNKVEIFSIISSKNIILFSDIDGFLTIINLKENFSNTALYVNILRKIKISNDTISIKGLISLSSILIEFNNQNLILNLFEDLLYPRKCSLFGAFGKIFRIYFCPKKISFIVINNELQVFIYKTVFIEKKFEILFLNYPFRIRALHSNTFVFKRIKIYQCLIKPRETVLFYGFNKILENFGSKKIVIKKIENREIFLNKHSPIYFDYIGRQLMVKTQNSIIKILITNPLQNSLSIKPNLLENRGNKKKVLYNDFFNEPKSDLFGKILVTLKTNSQIDVFKQKWNTTCFAVQKKIKIIFKKKCLSLNVSPNGNFLIFNFSGYIQIWKIFPTIKKVFAKKFNLTHNITNLHFFSKENNSLILLVTKKEVVLFDSTNNDIIYCLKLKIWEFNFDPWGQKFAILTDSFLSSNIQNKKSYYIFGKKNPIPILILNSDFFQFDSFLSIAFMWRKNFFYGNSIVFLNSLLEVFFIKY